MKKILSFALVLVMVMSLPLPAFAAKSFTSDTGVDVVSAATTKTNGNSKNVKAEKELPKGLQDKVVVPYGHRKDQDVSVEEMEAFIAKVEKYIENLDLDSDDDGIDDDPGDELSAQVIDLEAAETLALVKKDGSIVKMSFDGRKYKFEIWFENELFEVRVDGISKDVDVSSDDDEYDLDDIMSYVDAKAIALNRVNKTDAIITEVELDIESKDRSDDEDEDEDEDDDEDEDEDDDRNSEKEATYKVKVKTATRIYTVEFNAFNGERVAFKSDENDGDDDDWDRDRDRDRDDDDESMVSAIENLIDRIELELAKEHPELEHFMFQLDQKFYTLQKKYGEAPAKEEYTEDLKELIADLEAIKDDSVFSDTEQGLIQDLIDDMESALGALEDEDYITETVYEGFKDDAYEYLNMIDETVEDGDVEALVTEIRGFVLENKFGGELGEYSQEEAMELLMLAFEYSSIAKEDLDDYYKDLKLAYRKFKMSKLVAGDYLETLTGYKTDLDALVDKDLTEPEKTLRDELIKLITRIENADKMPLGIYYDIEQDVLTLIEVDEEDPTNYEEALDELINDVRVAIFASYEGVNQNELRNEKMTLLAHYFTAINDKKNADTDTESEFKAAVTKLETALKNFNDFINSETSN